ncbi:MAG: SGNH/GDSL hydrolase family protein [Kouleothrix sp.]|nr:SGNH/GDSL hydrolase family protein [Kouleothrix sp.]
MKTLVCFGDSLTEGAIGASYVDIVRERLAGQARVVNAGVNGDTTLNLLGRVERDVIALQPDAVVILAGLNDLTTAYGWRSNRVYYRTVKRVRVELTPRRFARAYRRLIATLRERSHARLALCTLTTVGERLDDPFQAYIDAYCAIIRALAEQERLPLIDLRAAFCAALAADPRDGPPYHIWTPLLDWATIGLRGQSYAALAERRGYRLLCDGAHLAEAGALLVAETMLPTLGPLLQITDQRPTTNDQRP